MFVRMLLEIRPKPGQHRHSPRRHGLGRSVRLRVRQEDRGPPTSFERRQIVAEKENNDFVIVAEPSLGHHAVSHPARKSSRPAA